MTTAAPTTPVEARAGTTAGRDTRARIVIAAARLLQERGYEAMSLKLVGAEAGVSGGSLYHFFPGGKEEIAVAAVAHAGEEFGAYLAATMAEPGSPPEVVEGCAEALAARLEASGWVEGCPLTATGLETAGRSAAIQAAVADAFRAWAEVVRDRLVEGGVDSVEAAELATTIINSLEGAEVAAQVARDPGPLRLVGKHLAALLRAYA